MAATPDHLGIGQALNTLPRRGAGRAAHALMSDLFPERRSLPVPGVEATLEYLGKRLPLAATRVATRTQLFDWTAPNLWTVCDTWIADESGRRLVDFNESGLHVVSCSTPVRGWFEFDGIRDRLFTLPDRPDLIAYRPANWAETWGCCLVRERLAGGIERAGRVEVVIDAGLAPGEMLFGEVVTPGKSDRECSSRRTSVSGLVPRPCAHYRLVHPLQPKFPAVSLKSHDTRAPKVSAEKLRTNGDWPREAVGSEDTAAAAYFRPSPKHRMRPRGIALSDCPERRLVQHHIEGRGLHTLEGVRLGRRRDTFDERTWVSGHSQAPL